MVAATYSPRNCIEPMPDQLLANPLDYIFADHVRQRIVCSLLFQIAGGTDMEEEVLHALTGFLREDLPRHVEDEETGLFPLLRTRCTEEDGIGTVLDRLEKEHSHDAERSEEIILSLEALAARRCHHLLEREADHIRRFARKEQDHLIAENNIVLPIARIRLTSEDLAKLAANMRARRGA